MGHDLPPGKPPVTRNRNVLHHDYTLHGHTLQTVNSVKYLGVTITKDLTWTEHINNQCTKASQTLGFLRRNLKIESRRIKEIAYKAYLRLILEYACTVWDPHTEKAINKIEAIQ